MTSRHKQIAIAGRLAAWLTLGLTLSIFALSKLRAAPPGTPPLRATRMKVICSTALFAGVDRGELINSAKLWVQTLGKRENLQIIDPEIVLVNNVRELRAQVDTGSVDLVVSSSLEYLAMDRARVLTPEITLTASPGGTGKIKYFLLVSRSGGIDTLADLKGKALNTYSRSASNLNRLWLDVLLGGAHLPSASTLFGDVTAVSKPSTACLPIFFGKSDACLIDEPSWDTLRELNPQIATKLKVLAESQPLVESLISIGARRQEYRSDIIHAIRNLQDDPEGRQVLLFFKCSRAVGISPADLEPVAELRSTYLKSTRPADRKVDLPSLGAGVAALELPKIP